MIESNVRPYYLQSDKIWPFLTRERQKWPSSVSTEFFISFEDALWSLLPRLGYKKGAIFLVPSLYCPDVIENIENHGYRVKEYPLKKDLNADYDEINKIIQKVKPDIFVDFAPAGVPNWISDAIYRKLPFHSLVILDRVHSLIAPTVDFFPPTDRFLLLNSFRKVSPFPGSLAVFSRNVRQTGNVPFSWYNTRGLLYWLIYQVSLRISRALHLHKFAATIAEKRLKVHDDLIGDVPITRQLPIFYRWLTEHIAVDRIKESKQIHAMIYHQRFLPYFEKHNTYIWQIHRTDDYFHELRGYPIIMKEPFADVFIKECRRQGLLVVAQLKDSRWSQDQKLVLLPLGPHLNEKNIRKITYIAEKALTIALQCDIIAA